ELGMVALTELVPAFRRMPEPLSELGARRELLQPFVDHGVFLAHAARPKPIDEDSPAVRLRRRVVHALDADPPLSSHRSPSFVAALARERARTGVVLLRLPAIGRSGARHADEPPYDLSSDPRRRLGRAASGR